MSVGADALLPRFYMEDKRCSLEALVPVLQTVRKRLIA